MQKLFQKLHNRALPFLLAVLMLASSLPLNVLSIGADTATDGTANGTPSPDGYIYDYDTLKITKDGKETYAMDLLTHEKITISADGLTEDATYQWQIRHNENDNTWINIYDATEKELPVTLALLGNLLRDDHTAMLRCRAYTDTYAYLTSPITVTVKEPTHTTITTPTQTTKDPSFAADGDDPETPEFVTVTIKYMLVKYIKVDGIYTYTEEMEAFSSYVATLAYNSNLTTVVDNPTIVGFTPHFVEGDTETPCDEVTIDLKNIQEDVTYKVLYKPSEDVPYRVQYLFQNIYDDLYSEDKNITGTDADGDPLTGAVYNGKGTTGKPPSKGVDGVEFEGFTALFYQPDTIAADGSTVFEVYFERNYYLMEFDCNGGYGVNTVYVRHGTYVSVPTPVRPGYVFAGWDLAEEVEEDGELVDKYDGVSDSLPSSMPPYNSKYKAIWATVQTTYTVVYWRENADDDGFSYWGSEQKTAMSASKVSGSDSVPLTISRATIDGNPVDEKPFFTYNDSLTDKDVLVEGDGSTIVNVYYNRNVYTLRFKVSDLGTFTPPPLHKHEKGVCYGVLDCDKAHKHDANCEKELNCSIPEHTAHTDACLTCTKTEHEHTPACLSSSCEQISHTHTSACCIQNEHTHNITCYGANSGYVLENNQSGFDPSDVSLPQEGYVYRYAESEWWNTTYYNYFYDGTNWYYLGTGNQYRGLISSNSMSDPGNENYISAPTTKAISCDITEHDHTSGCVYCTKEAGHIPDADCCTLTAHTHTSACYVLSSGYFSTTPEDDLTEYIKYGEVYPNNNILALGGRYYYKIGSSWYRIRDINDAQNVTISPICDLSEHTHGTGCKYCCINNHQHDDSCYTDVAHKHGESCYKDALHVHGEDCYIYHCDVDEHVHTADCYTTCSKPETYVTTSGSTSYYFIKAKYDQTIGDVWPTASNFTSSFYYWNIDNISSKVVSKRVTMSEDLCDTNDGIKHATGHTQSGTVKTYLNYMFESFDQTSGTSGANDVNRREYNDVYYDRDIQYSQTVYRENGNFGLKQITGMDPQMDYAASQTINGEQHLFLYYKRNRCDLFFHNVSDVVDAATKTDIMYGYPIKELTLDGKPISEFIQPYPSTYEPGAYEFKGWYTTPGCYEGTEVDWDKITLPNNDLTLYAKWVPIQRNVYFFEDLKDLQAFENDDDKSHCWQPPAPSPSISYPIVVDHGTPLGTTYNYIPTRTGVEKPSDYYFVGWFYFDENGKKKFAPDSMEVDRDLYLFAEWKTSLPTAYHIEFQAWKKNSDGSESLLTAEIAKPLEDYSTAGKTVTFDAAGGTRLYDLSGTGRENYQEKWFPETASHSLLMNADSDENNYTFRYFKKDYINYKVIYKDRVTGKILGESEVKHTEKAIVTEKYKPFETYYPEQYYIERPIAYDPTDYSEPGKEKFVLEENIIYFYYVPDTKHAPYHEKHFKENVAGDGYDLAKSYQGIADLNKMITEPVSEYTGFEFDYALVFHYDQDASGDWIRQEKEDIEPIENVNAVTGEVRLGGLDIEIYYKRIEVEYTIRYMLYGTTTVLQTVAQPPDAKDTFGSEVSHTSPAELEIDKIKYTYYLDDSTELDRTQSMTIRENAEDNVLTFYYKERTVLVNYHVVCTVPSLAVNNKVSLANERAATAGGLLGSKAMSGIGFQFVGWYYDEACTQAVPSEWVTEKDGDYELIPKAIVEDPDGEEHFYALFEPIYGKLQINKTVAGGEGDSGDTFLFRVKGKDHNNKHIDIIVSITDASPNVDTVLLNKVPIGNYTVTELTDWSWEYTTGTEECTAIVEKDKPTEVSFTNTPDPSNWLNGETVNENQFNP